MHGRKRKQFEHAYMILSVGRASRASPGRVRQTVGGVGRVLQASWAVLRHAHVSAQ